MGGFDCKLHAETSVKQGIVRRRVDAYNVHSRIHWGDALFASLAYAALLTTTLLPPVTVPPPLSKEQPGVASHLVSWIKKSARQRTSLEKSASVSLLLRNLGYFYGILCVTSRKYRIRYGDWVSGKFCRSRRNPRGMASGVCFTKNTQLFYYLVTPF